MMKKSIFIGLSLLLICCVRDMKFEKSKWNDRVDGFFEYRENMVEDLMDNHLPKGMTYSSVINLLGESGNYKDLEQNEIVYEIMVDYGWNIDPMEGKELYLEFGKDSTLINYRLEHWEH